MILPDKWGQGALLSYSAAHGNCSCENALIARLCADRFGLIFDTETGCTLYVCVENLLDVVFSAVTSDLIEARIKLDSGEFDVTVLFVSENTILISSDYAIDVKLEFAGDVKSKKTKKCVCYSTDSESFALSSKKENGTITFAFSYGNEAEAICSAALEADFSAALSQRAEFYESLPKLRIPNDDIKKLYYKCASVLFGCTNSSEGIIKSSYITPSKGNMNAAYSFSSALCTLGMRHLSPDLARQTLESILASQASDGMISGRISSEEKSCDINPPVLAWCFWELYSVSGDKKMLSDAYLPLKKYIHYIVESRDINKNYLYEWQIGDSPEYGGVESTMDNSPRFDDGIILDSIDFTSYIANEAAHMSLIAEETGKHGEALYWNVMFERIKNSVNELLFDEDDKLYYDRAVVSNMFKKAKTSASFLPLFAGICENRHAMTLLKYLNSEDRFNRKYGIPSVSADSEDFGDNMWRGPMHPYMNYFIAKGLEKYEMHDKANEIKSKTLDAVMYEYLNSGTLFEYYSVDGTKSAASLPKKGFSPSPFIVGSNNVNIRDYALTAAVIVDMLFSRSKKIAKTNQK